MQDIVQISSRIDFVANFLQPDAVFQIGAGWIVPI
jgi:hypothetical protein